MESQGPLAIQELQEHPGVTGDTRVAGDIGITGDTGVTGVKGTHI